MSFQLFRQEKKNLMWVTFSCNVNVAQVSSKTTKVNKVLMKSMMIFIKSKSSYPDFAVSHIEKLVSTHTCWRNRETIK